MSSRPVSTYGWIQRCQETSASSAKTAYGNAIASTGPSAVFRLPSPDSLRIPPVQEKMATRNPVARAIASATSRVWFPATLAFTRNLPRRSMHRGGRALAALYYRLRPEVPARRADQSRRHPRRARGFSGGAAPGLRDGGLALLGVGRLPALRDAPARGRGAPGRGRLGLLEHRGGAAGRQGRPPADRPPRQLGGRGADARAGQAADPRRARARHLPGRRARAAPAPRALRRDRDPRRPQLRADAFGPARPPVQRHRGHAGRPRLRQHRRGRAVLRARGVLPARAPARGDGLGRDRPARLHRASARRALPRDRRGAAADRDRRAIATRRCATNVQRYVAILERYVREYPEQWYCFYPFWDDPSRKRTEAVAESTAPAESRSTPVGGR